ncbi:MAG: hypothetical protein ACLRT4_12415 [Thomasclavelia sp.]
MKRTYLIILVTVFVYILIEAVMIKNSIPASKELTLKDVSVVIDPGHGGIN